MCDQQCLRSACAYAQSDQSLCWSLEYSMSVKLLTEHHLEFISLKGGCTGSSETTLVKMPHCWKSHAMAQICDYKSDSISQQMGVFTRENMSLRVCKQHRRRPACASTQSNQCLCFGFCLFECISKPHIGEFSSF